MFILDFIQILNIFIWILIGIFLLFILIVLPIVPNCSCVIILIGVPLSFSIWPKYFPYSTLGITPFVFILMIFSLILLVINSHLFVFISIFNFDISSIISLNAFWIVCTSSPCTAMSSMNACIFILFVYLLCIFVNISFI